MYLKLSKQSKLLRADEEKKEKPIYNSILHTDWSIKRNLLLLLNGE